MNGVAGNVVAAGMDQILQGTAAGCGTECTVTQHWMHACFTILHTTHQPAPDYQYVRTCQYRCVCVLSVCGNQAAAGMRNALRQTG
jgi:hypothetical protein